MQLHPTILPWLYGRKLYRLSASEPKAAQEQPAEAVTAVPSWQTVPQPRAALVVAAEELNQPVYGELLDNILKAMGLSRQEVNLLAVSERPSAGVLVGGGVPLVVFGDALSVKDVEAYVLPSLGQMHADTQYKRSAWETIKAFKATL